MSSLRQTFRVAWSDQEAVEVTTNARDMAAAQDYADDPVTGSFALVYHALERTGVAVPAFDAFIDGLDEFELVAGSVNGSSSLDPTSPAAGENAP